MTEPYSQPTVAWNLRKTIEKFLWLTKPGTLGTIGPSQSGFKKGFYLFLSLHFLQVYGFDWTQWEIRTHSHDTCKSK